MIEMGGTWWQSIKCWDNNTMTDKNSIKYVWRCSKWTDAKIWDIEFVGDINKKVENA